MAPRTTSSHVVGVAVAEVERWIATHAPRGEQAHLAAVAKRLMAAPSTAAAGLTVEQWVVVTGAVVDFLGRAAPAAEVARILPASWDLVVANLERCTGPCCLTVETTTVMVRCMDSPFIFEGVRTFLRKEGIRIFLSLHPTLAGLDGADHLIYLQIERIVDPRRLARLRTTLAWLLRGLRLSIIDFPRFQSRLAHIGAALAARPGGAEAAAFCGWLGDGHLIFLGYEQRRATAAGGWALVDGAALGLARDRRLLDRLIPGLGGELAGAAAVEGGWVAVDFSPAGTTIRHHREPAETFFFETLDAEGTPRRHCIVGRLSRGGVQAAASEVPLLRAKLAQLLDARGQEGGHYQRREIATLFNLLPKRELLYAPLPELVARFDELLAIEGDEGLSVGYRAGRGGRYWAVTVGLPRVRYGEAVVERLAAAVAGAFAAPVIDEVVSLGDAVAVVVFYLAVVDGVRPPAALALRETLRAVLTTWEERLLGRLIERLGEHPAFVMLHRYGPTFPALYREVTTPAVAAEDLARLAQLGDAEGVVVYCTRGEGGGLQLRILTDHRLSLMALIPTLRNFGLVATDETQAPLGGGAYTVHVVHLGGDPTVVRARCGDLCTALGWTLTGHLQDDPTNALILLAALSPAEVRLVRTVRGYLLQVNPTLMEGGVVRTLLAYPAAVAALVALFVARFDPAVAAGRAQAVAAAQRRFAHELAAVSHLADDEVLRGLANVVAATVRTNFFQPGVEVVAIKVDCSRVERMVKPRPWREIYCHGAELEGCHLRGGPVARGGLRHSDRPDDFRTEILGLMKAQTVKNSVIVPVGAKGGFCLRHPPAEPEARARYLHDQYQAFIEVLLSVTDNLVGGQVVHPPHTVVEDGDDPYLVVAADKGTAHLSDAANEVTARLGFWLGDAFASGGATGYDHKREGITARGAWICIRRHFRELDFDIDREDFTVVGIGDMAGDVFGNAMVRSRHLRLIGAFNHRHIFLDPNPDPALSFAERARLFRLPHSTWGDYDRDKISAGGGVFERDAKQIDLHEAARERLATRKARVSGEELIRLLLSAPVDLLYNGGIGTYIKAANERDVEVGDKANDRVRVNGAEVRARVVGEGGNLGITQRGRLEIAAHGGRINTDALDNSAGVDLSDHEVNLKLLCQHLCEIGRLSGKARDRLLARATGEVAALCLADNEGQSACVSLDELRSHDHPTPFLRLIEQRVAEGLLPAAEVVATPTELREQVATQGRLARPTLCVLLGHEKLRLERLLTDSPLGAAAGSEPYLAGYFPDSVARRFRRHLAGHPLRRQILATVVANRIVNQAGVCFFFEVEEESGCAAWEIAHAYLFAEAICDAGATRLWIANLEDRLEARLQYDLLLRQEALLAELTRRLLHLSPDARPPLTAIPEVRRQVHAFELELQGRRYEGQVAELRGNGVPAVLARHVARLPALAGILEVLDLHRSHHLPFGAIAKALEEVAERLALDTLARRLGRRIARDAWEERAKVDLEEEVDTLRYRLARHLLTTRHHGEGVGAAVERFFTECAEPVAAYHHWLSGLEAEARLLRYTVVVHHLRALLPGEGVRPNPSFAGRGGRGGSTAPQRSAAGVVDRRRGPGSRKGDEEGEIRPRR